MPEGRHAKSHLPSIMKERRNENKGKTSQGGGAMHNVAVMKYKESFESLKKATELVGGLQGFSGASKVVIKPNLVECPE